MRIPRMALAAVLPAFLLACGGDRPADDPVPGEVVRTEGPDATDMGGQVMNVAITPVGGASVMGDVMFEEVGQQTRITLMVRDAPGAGTHQAHVHTGTCQSPGSVVAPLEPVTADANGSGQSTSTVDRAYHDLFDGNHMVGVHVAGGDPGAIAGCADLAGHAM